MPQAASALTSGSLAAQQAAYAAALGYAGYGSTGGVVQQSISPTTYTTSALSGATTGTTAGAGVELFVHNIGSDTEESVLWRLFGPFGAVLNVKVCTFCF